MSPLVQRPDRIVDRVDPLDGSSHAGAGRLIFRPSRFEPVTKVDHAHVLPLCSVVMKRRRAGTLYGPGRNRPRLLGIATGGYQVPLFRLRE